MPEIHFFSHLLCLALSYDMDDTDECLYSERLAPLRWKMLQLRMIFALGGGALMVH